MSPRLFPVGSHVRGRVSAVPWGAGRTGVMVDLGAGPGGFVDMILLPGEADDWPTIGQEAVFEVLQHRGNQVRLLPVDPSLRCAGPAVSPWSDEQWAALVERHPAGAPLTGTVTAHYHEEYVVRFDDFSSVVESEETLPPVGTVAGFVVTRHLEPSRRIEVRPAPPGGGDGARHDPL